jgi:hypothetical protein
VENCQIGVFLSYATKNGRTFLDRELYLPKEWADDPARCEGTGIPEGRGFKTKPALAIDTVERALDAGVPAKWAAGDAVYGQYSRGSRYGKGGNSKIVTNRVPELGLVGLTMPTGVVWRGVGQADVTIVRYWTSKLCDHQRTGHCTQKHARTPQPGTGKTSSPPAIARCFVRCWNFRGDCRSGVPVPLFRIRSGLVVDA